MRVPLMVGAVLALAALGGCGGGPATASPTPGGQPAAIECHAAGGGTAVAITNFAFNPASATIAVGSEVAWTNNDPSTHTVTFDNGPDCGQVANGASVGATFSVAGTYAYHCRIHPSMKGTIVVE